MNKTIQESKRPTSHFLLHQNLSNTYFNAFICLLYSCPNCPNFYCYYYGGVERAENDRAKYLSRTI